MEIADRQKDCLRRLANDDGFFNTSKQNKMNGVHLCTKTGRHLRNMWVVLWSLFAVVNFHDLQLQDNRATPSISGASPRPCPDAREHAQYLPRLCIPSVAKSFFSLQMRETASKPPMVKPQTVLLDTLDEYHSCFLLPLQPFLGDPIRCHSRGMVCL